MSVCEIFQIVSKLNKFMNDSLLCNTTEDCNLHGNFLMLVLCLIPT